MVGVSQLTAEAEKPVKKIMPTNLVRAGMTLYW